MPVRSTRSVRPKAKRTKKIRVSSAVLEEMVEERAEQIVHQHNIFDLKMVIALTIIGVASIVMNAMASNMYNVSATSSTTATVSSTGRILVEAKSDYYTNPTVVIPNSTVPSTTLDQTILGKWNVVAENEPVALKKVTLSAINPDYTVRTTATEFGQLNLFNNSGTMISAGTMINGAVQFNLNNYIVEPGKPQTLTLKGVVTGSGVMKENSIIRFGVNLQVPNTWRAVGTVSGKDLGFTDFNFRGPNYAMAALSSFYLYHNSVPFFTSPWSYWSSTNKPVNSESKIFPLFIKTMGERDLRISKIMISVTASGLVNSGVTSTTSLASSTVGVIKGFKLYESSQQNDLIKLVATSKNCIVGAQPGGPTTGTVVVPNVGTCGIGNTFVWFDASNDVDGAFDSLIIPASDFKHFMLVADTTQALQGVTPGKKVSLVAEVKGNRGPMPTSNPKITTWSGGGIFYHYTPIGKTENVTAYNQANTYPTIGNPMNFGL